MATESHPVRMAPLLKTEEVAEILRVSPRTVRRMGESGELERVHVGGRLTRYRADSIATLIESTTSNGAPPQDAAAKTREITAHAQRTP